MDFTDFNALIQPLVTFVVSMGEEVNALPGGLAFTLGLFTWFVVEQILRRLFSWLRWAILAAAIVGLGYTLPRIVNEFFDRATLPPLNGDVLRPEMLLPDEPQL